VPPWGPTKGEWAAASLTSAERAVKSGLKYRSLETTVHDTMEWFRTLPAERQAKLRAGIEPQKEADTLKAWHERPKSA
jgi:2'-hydroxyisoflavone reductase